FKMGQRLGLVVHGRQNADDGPISLSGASTHADSDRLVATSSRAGDETVPANPPGSGYERECHRHVPGHSPPKRLDVRSLEGLTRDYPTPQPPTPSIKKNLHPRRSWPAFGRNQNEKGTLISTDRH